MSIDSPPPEALENSELFGGLPASGVAEAIACGRVQTFHKGTTIFIQGAPAERAHIVLAGRVRIQQTDEEGAQMVVRFIGPGQTFGTVGMFTNRLYPGDAIAVTDSSEMSWSEQALLALMAHYPPIGMNLIRTIGRRLQESQDRLRELATQRVERRIANALLRLAAQAGKTGSSGTEIDFPLSRKDVAEICGASLHTVSRTLKSWEMQGAIHTSHQRLTIRDIEDIRRRAEETVIAADQAIR
jgi:CRP-like cAMP-binding protein